MTTKCSRCTKCKGRKNIMGTGYVMKKCPLCDGVGYLESKAREKKVEHVEEIVTIHVQPKEVVEAEREPEVEPEVEAKPEPEIKKEAKPKPKQKSKPKKKKKK